MLSGLDRLGRAGMLALLLMPPLFFAAIRMGSHAYCVRSARNDAQSRQLLENLPIMEQAMTQAQLALQPLKASPPGDPGRAEEFGRWLLDVAKAQKVDLQGLIISPTPSDPLTPALSAEFRFEQDLVGTIRLLQSLQADTRVVIFETLRLRLTDQQQDPARYLVEARLRAHTIASLK